MLFCTVSLSSISVGSSNSRTHWHVLSALHCTGLPALVYDDPYTGFQLRNCRYPRRNWGDSGLKLRDGKEKGLWNKRDEELGVIGVQMVGQWRLGNQSTEWSSVEIKEYRTKYIILRNTTVKGQGGGEMGVYGDRKRAIGKIWEEPVKSIAGNSKPTGETMNEYQVVDGIKSSRLIEKKLAGIR